jgi:cytochrome c-type biogenesis protein CcmH
MPDLSESALPASIATSRARLLALEAARAQGTLDDVAYEAARREAERQLGAAVLATMPAPNDSANGSKPSWRLVASVMAVVLAVAIGGYAFTGSPSLAGIGAPPVAPVTASNVSPDAGANPAPGDREVGLQQIAEMVDRLAARLKDKPDDAEGWTMLARSYTVLTRYRESLPAYRRAVELQPRDAGLLADYADATVAANDGKPDAASTALIERALAIDPKQPKALALAGTVAFERGDYASAAAQWQKIADALPPGSEFHQQVMANIDEARRRGGLTTAAPRAMPGASAALASAAPSPSSAAGHEALTGTVSLDPALAASASPDDTVFVLARPESGRMPLAVFRAKVKDLPLRFRLDDSMAMTPTMKISDMKHVIVAARVSKSGNAISQPGDLAGEIGPVAPGSTGLAIVIGHAVPAK